jgi:hypothetical protein
MFKDVTQVSNSPAMREGTRRHECKRTATERLTLALRAHQRGRRKQRRCSVLCRPAPGNGAKSHAQRSLDVIFRFVAWCAGSVQPRRPKRDRLTV